MLEKGGRGGLLLTYLRRKKKKSTMRFTLEKEEKGKNQAWEEKRVDNSSTREEEGERGRNESSFYAEGKGVGEKGNVWFSISRRGKKRKGRGGTLELQSEGEKEKRGATEGWKRLSLHWRRGKRGGRDQPLSPSLWKRGKRGGRGGGSWGKGREGIHVFIRKGKKWGYDYIGGGEEKENAGEERGRAFSSAKGGRGKEMFFTHRREKGEESSLGRRCTLGGEKSSPSIQGGGEK